MEGRRGEGRKEGRKELESHTTAQLGFLILITVIISNYQVGKSSCCYKMKAKKIVTESKGFT
jgi:hypothetical protein